MTSQAQPSLCASLFVHNQHSVSSLLVAYSKELFIHKIELEIFVLDLWIYLINCLIINHEICDFDCMHFITVTCRMDSSDRSLCSLLMLVVCLSAVLQPALGGTVGLCPAGQYLKRDDSGRSCTSCSKCPLNEIVRRPCSDNKDTICGPFYEFEFFNQETNKDDAQESDFNLFHIQTTTPPPSRDQLEKERATDRLAVSGKTLMILILVLIKTLVSYHLAAFCGYNSPISSMFWNRFA